MSSAYIEISEVGKDYVSRDGSVVHAVDQVSCNVFPGEFVAIVGPSGCGKSTLLKMVGGLSDPTRGRIHFQGGHPRLSASGVGMIFQDAVLLPWRNVKQNICLAVDVMGLPRAEAEARADMLIELVGLTGFGSKYPAELSGGMQQRAAIARALLPDPPLLLMDEPFGALDALTRERMAEELMNIWGGSGKTVLFVTHSVNEAVLLADRVIVMSDRPARIKDIIEVQVKRPRSFDNVSDAQFQEYAVYIRYLLFDKGV